MKIEERRARRRKRAHDQAVLDLQRARGSAPIEEMALITHRAVVDTLPASIRRDFEEPEPGELWRVPGHTIESWGVIPHA